jgi:hypothetical protein
LPVSEDFNASAVEGETTSISDEFPEFIITFRCLRRSAGIEELYGRLPDLVTRRH